MSTTDARNYRVGLRDRLAYRLASIALAAATPEYRKYVTYLWGTGKQALDTEVAELHRVSEQAAALDQAAPEDDQSRQEVLSREWALSAPSDDGVREVVMTEPVWADFIGRVYDRGLHVYPIPFTGPGDLPSYSVGIGPR